MSTKFWIASAGMCILTLTLVAAESPFAGTWKLNPSKSTLEGGLASTATVRIEPDGSGLKISVESVNAQGQPVNFTYQATLDGKSVKVTGSPTADETSTRRVNSHTYTATGMKNGKVVFVDRRTVSKDGKTMTISRNGTDGEGKPFHATMVFDKQ